MKFIKPNFYDRFRCTASACSDTCCAGWEIDIDPDTRKYYEELEGPFGDRLREQIEETPEGIACFRLGEGDRCPFLTDDNLCELILELGENSLCEICREHPRFYEQIGDRMEMGIGLCCEEACRLLFEENEPITFITTTVPDMPDVVLLPDTGMEIYRLRDEAFMLVQDRSLPLRVRMHRLLEFGERVQKQICGGPAPADVLEEDNLPTAREALFGVMERLEPYDDTWPDTVRLLEDTDLQVNLDDIDGGFENLMVYFLYRHFARGALDGRVVGRVKFCAVSVWFICLMNTHCLAETGAFTPWDRIVCTKDYSKQVEYSAENMEDMLFALQEDPAFSTENLKRMFG
ncbi:MAG: flagellin lysine-N-methylase [Clostridia bacterium]|nr:flagellin lysine-N-methylase [Clostridia bacterium]